MVNMSKAFRPLFLLSLGLATLAVVTPLAVGPANASLAIRVSIVSAASWIATVVYASAKFKKTRFMVSARHTPDFLLVLRAFSGRWGCAHTIRACT
jgi:hypothetical protein